MILKSIPTKSSISKLIKYVFKEQEALIKPSKQQAQKPFYVPGVKLTQRDLHHLEAERVDGKLLQELKHVFKGDVKKFIEAQLSKKDAVKDPQAQKPFVIKNHVTARRIEGYCRQFAENESRRLYKRSDSNVAEHVILSWSPKDAQNITDTMLKDLAQKYISLRAPDCLVIGTKHVESTKHVHLHLIVAGVKLNGLSNRVSKQEFQSIKKSLQLYEQERYGHLLSHSQPRHGRRQSIEKDKEAPEKNIKTQRRTDEVTLLRCLDEVYKTSISKNDFLEKLQAMGHESYYRNNHFQGIKFEGERKFRINRFGYTEEKLQALDIIKVKQEKELQNLKALREHQSNEKNMLHGGFGLVKEDTSIELEKNTEPNKDEALQELADIRQSADQEMDLDNEPDEDMDSQDDSEDEESEDNDTDDADTEDSSDTDYIDDSDDTE